MTDIKLRRDTDARCPSCGEPAVLLGADSIGKFQQCDKLHRWWDFPDMTLLRIFRKKNAEEYKEAAI